MPEPDISILCPTRRRSKMLHDSCQSLLATAANTPRIEFLIAIDPDEDAELMLPAAANVTVWIAPERYGYDRLHEYYNALAARARGKWCVLWNDDAEMRTSHWDLVLDAQPGTQLLWMQANHHCTGNLFPVWPRAWSAAMGHASLSPNVDRWLSEVARAINLERQVPIQVFHDRADITGNNMDQTYREGREVMGDCDHADFYSQANIVARNRDIRIVEELVYGAPTCFPCGCPLSGHVGRCGALT